MLTRRAKQYLSNQSAYKSSNAFTHLLEHAGKVEQRTKRAEIRAVAGASRSNIDGELIAIKDNICTFDLPTTCASSILKGYQSPFDATVVRNLRDAGAIVAGKTNLDEFGMGSHSLHSAFGPIFQQPRDTKLSVGGSSGGSALAVATEQCWAAIGTDTGGSVRLPAAYTGIFGFKPSYGLISRHGVVAYANSLDTVGILGRELDPVEDIYREIRNYDPQDPTSLPQSTRDRISRQLRGRKKRRRLRIGVPEEYNISQLDPPVRLVWRRVLLALARESHDVVSVSLPSTKLALPAYYILAPAEASSNLAKYDGVRFGVASASKSKDDVLFAGTRGKGLGAEVQRRILLGSFTLSASAIDNYFIQAQRVRRLIQQDFDKVFSFPNPLADPGTGTDDDASDGVDILLTPTAPSLPPKLSDLAGRTALASYQDDVLTVPASLAGLPAMNVPAGKFKPAMREDDYVERIGLQIMAQYGDDEMVFHAAKILQDLRGGFNLMHTPS